MAQKIMLDLFDPHILYVRTSPAVFVSQCPEKMKGSPMCSLRCSWSNFPYFLEFA